MSGTHFGLNFSRPNAMSANWLSTEFPFGEVPVGEIYVVKMSVGELAVDEIPWYGTGNGETKEKI